MVDDDSAGEPTGAITCAVMAEMLTDLMEGDLATEAETAALNHLASCRACETVLAETRAVRDLTRDHGRVDLESDDRKRMLDAILAEVTETTNADRDGPGE